MKKQLKKLGKILKQNKVPTDHLQGVKMYLAVCFLGLKSDDVSAYFGVKYTKVRHNITVYGLRLQKNKSFLALMHKVAAEYSAQKQLELAA